MLFMLLAIFKIAPKPGKELAFQEIGSWTWFMYGVI